MIVYEETLLVPYASSEPVAETLIVLAPHPDDEVLGCGGLAAKVVRLGGRVHPLVLTDGSAGNFTGPEAAAEYAATRREESRRAARILGTDEPLFLDFADRSLPTAMEELRERIGAEMKRLGPAALLAPSPAEVHPDHRATARAAWDAFAASDCDRLVFYEVSATLAPNRLVAIDDVVEKKVEAARQFQSQLRERPFVDLIRGLNRYRSMTLPPTTRWAEAFHEVRRAELRDLDWPGLVSRLGPVWPRPGFASGA